MEYNTQRPSLKIADYGRIVQRMIGYARQLPTREDRTRMATEIVGVMAHLNPKIKERTDYQHILWDHLMIMADYDLDCDCPYTINREETEHFHPSPIPLPGKKITYRHYGRTLESMVHAVAEMPPSEARDMIVGQIASTMKRQYLQWNRDTVEDETIARQLQELSDNKLQLPADFEFKPTEMLIAQNPSAAQENSKKKKKKKKKKSNVNGQF